MRARHVFALQQTVHKSPACTAHLLALAVCTIRSGLARGGTSRVADEPTGLFEREGGLEGGDDSLELLVGKVLRPCGKLHQHVVVDFAGAHRLLACLGCAVLSGRSIAS